MKKLRGGRARLRVSDLTIESHPGWLVEVDYVGQDLVRLTLSHKLGDNAPPITTALLRQVSPERLRRAAHARRIRDSLLGELQLDDALLESARFVPRSRKGRAGRPRDWTDDRLAKLAARYGELLAIGVPDPYAVLTKEFGDEDRPTAVRGAMQLARTQKLWEPAGKGRRGGKLTPKAKRILRKGRAGND